MTDEKHEDWRVVVVGTDSAKCRVCGQPVARGERAWYLSGRGLQCLECPVLPLEDGEVN
jgi:hypothetical protein